MRRLLVVLLFVSGCGGIVVEPAADAGPGATADTGGVKPVPDGSIVPPPPPPPPPDAGCSTTGGTSGVVMGSTCRADEEIRASLAIECGSAGIAVLDYRDACGSWSYRNFNCCSPDGTGCGPMRHDGSPSSCKDEGTWRKYSDEDCAKDGKVVGKFTVDTACGGGGHRGYSFTCCAHP